MKCTLFTFLECINTFTCPDKICEVEEYMLKMFMLKENPGLGKEFTNLTSLRSRISERTVLKYCLKYMFVENLMPS